VLVLSTIGRWLPQLRMLQLSLDCEPNAPALVGSDHQTILQPIFGLLDPGQRRQPAEHGCLPWVLLGCSELCEIEFALSTTAGSSQFNAGSDLAPHPERVDSTFLTIVCSAWRRLVRLNIRGVAPLVLETLLKVELPTLAILQCGDCAQAVHAHSQDPVYWPPQIVPRLARAFPTLTGLDVAHARVAPHGVSFDDLRILCRGCVGLCHLDLSQVITHVEYTLTVGRTDGRTD
jgi:hypothetical protein